MTQKKANDPINTASPKRYNLAAERVRLGMTQEQLADALSCTAETLGEWENDASGMPGEAMVKASALFGCSLDYLLNQTDERHSEAANTDSHDLMLALQTETHKTINLLGLLSNSVLNYAETSEEVYAQEAFYGLYAALRDRSATLELLTDRF